MINNNRTRTLTERIVVVLLLLIGIAGANILAFTFGAGDTGDVANQAFGQSNYFFPASYVFGTIWPTIYLLFAGLAVHQLLPSEKGNPRYAAGLPWMAASVFLNTGWIAVFDSQLFVWSFWAILPIVALAVVGHLKLGIATESEASTAERIVRIGPRIYTAWLTVATIAAASSALITVGWGGFGLSGQAWALIMLVIGGALGGAFMLLFRDPAFPAVYAYAYIGIAVRWLARSRAVGVTSLVLAGLLVIVFVLGVTRLRRIRRAPETNA